VAALTPDMFYDYYLAKNYKIDNISTIANQQKISMDLKSLEF
jgi:hypothetical protein